MTDEQFERFTKYLDYRFETFRDEMRDEMDGKITERLDEVYVKLDHIVGMLDTHEGDRMATNLQGDEFKAAIKNHEMRIGTLESAIV